MPTSHVCALQVIDTLKGFAAGADGFLLAQRSTLVTYISDILDAYEAAAVDAADAGPNNGDDDDGDDDDVHRLLPRHGRFNDGDDDDDDGSGYHHRRNNTSGDDDVDTTQARIHAQLSADAADILGGYLDELRSAVGV